MLHIWTFSNLDGVYTYFVLNDLRLPVFDEIAHYFNESSDYDYWFLLENIKFDVYSITNWPNLLFFDTTHIFSVEESVNYLTNLEV